MVVVDKFNYVGHFIQVKSTYKEINIIEIFKKKIFWLYGILKEYILDRDKKLTSIFWKALLGGLDTKFNSSTTYHPQIDG